MCVTFHFSLTYWQYAFLMWPGQVVQERHGRGLYIAVTLNAASERAEELHHQPRDHVPNPFSICSWKRERNINHLMFSPKCLTCQVPWTSKSAIQSKLPHCNLDWIHQDWMLQSSPWTTAKNTLSANWSLKPTRQVTPSSRKMWAMKEKHPFKGPWTLCCGFYTSVNVICIMNLCNCYLASVNHGRSFDYASLMGYSFPWLVKNLLTVVVMASAKI